MSGTGAGWQSGFQVSAQGQSRIPPHIHWIRYLTGNFWSHHWTVELILAIARKISNWQNSWFNLVNSNLLKVEPIEARIAEYSSILVPGRAFKDYWHCFTYDLQFTLEYDIIDTYPQEAWSFIGYQRSHVHACASPYFIRALNWGEARLNPAAGLEKNSLPLTNPNIFTAFSCFYQNVPLTHSFGLSYGWVHESEILGGNIRNPTNKVETQSQILRSKQSGEARLSRWRSEI